MVAAVRNGIVWFDGPADGAWNMAMDQAMLLYAAEHDCIVLRIYQWSQPTLSLGYFQDYNDRLSIPNAAAANCVRRVTGGGAILHDREITYSLALPRSFEERLELNSNKSLASNLPSTASNSKRALGHSEALYRVVHENITKWLINLGFAASMFDSAFVDPNKPSGQFRPGLPEQHDPKAFLCFDRRANVDIVIATDSSSPEEANRKVVGSAQRRSNNVLLQHGSLLLGPSPIAPHLLGLNQVGSTQRISQVDNASSTQSGAPGIWNWAIDFCNVLQESVEQLWECKWEYEEQPPEVLVTTSQISRERFQSEDWTIRKRKVI